MTGECKTRKTKGFPGRHAFPRPSVCSNADSESTRDTSHVPDDQTRRRDAVIKAIIEGEESGVSYRTPEDIRMAVKKELRLNEKL